MICPECKRQMVLSGTYWICGHHEEPIFIKIDEEETSLQETFFQDEDLWEKEVFDGDEYPSIIAHEYWRLYELIKNGQSYGALLQLKDVLEVLLKLPILAIASEIYSKEEKNNNENHILAQLVDKPLALGDWERIGHSIKKIHKINNASRIILVDIIDRYSKMQVTNWRNSTIGHGALAFKDDLEFNENIKKNIEIIKNHFKKVGNEYKNFKMFLKKGSKKIALVGRNMARDLEDSDDHVYLKLEKSDLTLYPFIMLYQNNIYFFDSYF